MLLTRQAGEPLALAELMPQLEKGHFTMENSQNPVCQMPSRSEGRGKSLEHSPMTWVHQSLSMVSVSCL